MSENERRVTSIVFDLMTRAGYPPSYEDLVEFGAALLDEVDRKIAKDCIVSGDTTWRLVDRKP